MLQNFKPIAYCIGTKYGEYSRGKCRVPRPLFTTEITKVCIYIVCYHAAVVGWGKSSDDCCCLVEGSDMNQALNFEMEIVRINYIVDKV